MRHSLVALVWAIAASWALPEEGAAHQSTPEEQNIAVWAATLARNTHRADRAEYLPVDSAWRNPTLVLDLGGLFIRRGADGSRRETDLLTLAKDLASLPASAWPLGRVVVFARTARTFTLVELTGSPEPSAPSDPRVEEAAAKAKRVIEILRLLDVEIVHAPVS